MLSLPFVRDNKETVLAALAKRGFKETALIDRLIEVDQDRRQTQTTLDQKLAEANQKAKEIGALYKSGNAAEANLLKEQTSTLKGETKSLQEQLQNLETELLEIRTKIPNIPHESVPAGNSEADNEEVFRAGTIPELYDGELPHWELASAYDLIAFD